MSCQLRVQVALPVERTPQYQLNWRLAGPRSRSVGFGEEKNLLPLLGIELRYLANPAHTLGSIAAIGYYPGFFYLLQYNHETS
jgi:hypothetical protein